MSSNFPTYPSIKDEGTLIDSTTNELDFVGAGVTASQTSTGKVQVSIPGSSSGITDLTGDVTATGPGPAVATISNSAVTYAKIQNESASSLLGNPTALPSAPSEITLNATLSFAGTTLQRAALTGDVTATAGSNSTTISAASVTYSKIQNVAASRLLGNPTGSPASTSEISLNSTLSFTGTSLQRAQLTGDVTATAGSNATTIASNAVTYAKMQQASVGNVALVNSSATAANYAELVLAASNLLGRGSTGNIAAITLGAGLAMTGTVLSSSVTGGFTSATTNLQTFTANGTYTRSANMKYALVICGGGGGGSGGIAGGGPGTSGASGGGGSGGVTLAFYSSAAVGATASVTIGAGGSAGSSAGGNGGPGGATSFGALTSAAGGVGGSGTAASASYLSTNGGAGGAGGGAQIYLIGNRGGNGQSFGVNGGTTAGYGASNPFMGGGVLGVPAGNTGAGAGGVTTTTGSPTAGIAGDSGYCLVYEFIFS